MMFEQKRLLIVDDETAVALAFERVAQGAGYVTRTASSPDGFRQAFDEFSPTAVLLDVYLASHEDGIDLLNWLAHRGFRGSVIAVSGAAAYAELLELESREAGFTGKLLTATKPITPEQLEELLTAPPEGRKTSGSSGGQVGSRLAEAARADRDALD